MRGHLSTVNTGALSVCSAPAIGYGETRPVPPVLADILRRESANSHSACCLLPAAWSPVHEERQAETQLYYKEQVDPPSRIQADTAEGLVAQPTAGGDGCLTLSGEHRCRSRRSTNHTQGRLVIAIAVVAATVCTLEERRAAAQLYYKEYCGASCCRCPFSPRGDRTTYVAMPSLGLPFQARAALFAGRSVGGHDCSTKGLLSSIAGHRVVRGRSGS